jgi:hypothetical protein
MALRPERAEAAVQQKSRNFIPAFLPHSTLRTTLNLYLMRRRRFTPVSHTRSDYCVFASLTMATYQNLCPRHVTSCGDKAGSSSQGGCQRLARSQPGAPLRAANAADADFQPARRLGQLGQVHWSHILGSIKEPSWNYYGTIKVLSRYYQGTIRVLLGN